MADSKPAGPQQTPDFDKPEVIAEEIRQTHSRQGRTAALDVAVRLVEARPRRSAELLVDLLVKPVKAQPKRKRFRYRYLSPNGDPVAKCPACNNDLTQPGGIEVTYATNQGETFTGHSHLHADGLLDDPERLIAAGKHSATACGSCQESLGELDDIDEWQEEF